eukprot:m.129299 g.129299  ORF g.129299 m.129299 type:complete len:375 (+) comp16755_c2_seq1:87-1211(+)
MPKRKVQEEEDVDAMVISGDDEPQQRSNDKPKEAKHSYNPSQPQDQRRTIRAKYRQLLKTTEVNKDDVGITADSLRENLVAANKLFDSVQMTREAVLDSQLLSLTARKGAEQAQKLHTSMVTFDPKIFTEKLKTFMSGRELTTDEVRDGDVPDLDWAKLGDEALDVSRAVPVLDIMLGPLSMDTAKRVVKPRQQKQKHNEQERTKLLQGEEAVANHEEQTTERVEEVLTVLSQELDRRRPALEDEEELPKMPLFELIINPDSFAQSIENLFHLSFLIKEGKTTIFVDDDDSPDPQVAVLTSEDVSEEEMRESKKNPLQTVIGFTENDWRRIVKAYGIKRSLIPHRKSSGSSSQAVAGKDKQKSPTKRARTTSAV